jgi:hypothetical protein
VQRKNSDCKRVPEEIVFLWLTIRNCGAGHRERAGNGKGGEESSVFDTMFTNPEFTECIHIVLSRDESGIYILCGKDHGGEVKRIKVKNVASQERPRS